MMNKARLLVGATIVAAFACGMAAADQAEGGAGSGPIGTLSGVTGAVEVQRSGITVSVTDGFQLMLKATGSSRGQMPRFKSPPRGVLP